MAEIEIQIDRLVGPTHHFGGLGVGNVASMTHGGQVSNPAAAALQGLAKMRLVAELTDAQFVLPPQPRPDFGLLRGLGFSGSDDDVLKRALDQSPGLLSAACSTSAMWTANAATVTGHDVTVANLSSSLHRSIESRATAGELRKLLPDSFRVHDGLPGGHAMRDEGAANHMRLAVDNGDAAIDVFVYGDGAPDPVRYMPRQSQASFAAIARRHGLAARDFFLLKQSAVAIDAGAFHNDVVAISHGRMMIHHEFAFHQSDRMMSRLEEQFIDVTGQPILRIEVAESELSIDDAVATYLFNSQVVKPVGAETSPILICPVDVSRHAAANAMVDRWIAAGHFADARYLDLAQSMSGGGGPACLRLRVPMSVQQVGQCNQLHRWTPELHRRCEEVVREYYPTSVTIRDLADEVFMRHAAEAQQRVEEIFETK